MFEKNDTHERVISIIGETLKLDKESVKPEATFEGLGADSLDRLEIIMKIEEAFGVDISDEQEAKINSIQGAVETIHALRKK